MRLPKTGNAAEPSLAQFNHRAWTTKDGAPALVSPWLRHATAGFGLGAATGLYRFDGIQFEHIELRGLDPRRSRAISMLYASESGALWIGYVEGGVTLLKEGQFTHFGEAEGMGHGTVLSWAEDTRGWNWMACTNALWRYDGHQWGRVGSDWGFPDKYARVLSVDQRGTVWVAGERETFYLERQSQRFERAGVRVEGDSGEFIESPDARTWYVDDAGVHSLPAQGAGSLRAPSTNARTSFATLIDRAGSLWRIGESIKRLPFDRSRNELSFDDYPTPDRFTTKEGLSDALTRSMLEDREGNVWVGTAGGLDRFRATNVHALPPPMNESGGHALAPAENGAIWIGSDAYLLRSSLDGLGSSTVG